MNRKKLLQWFVLFFAAMFLLTFLSRTVDSVSVAKVKVNSIQNQMITHGVSGTGKIEGTKELAIFAKEGQRISEIHIQEGQNVKKGDVLFQLSIETLEESIEEKKGEILELKGKIKDLSSEKELAEEKKAQEQLRAEENYETAVKNGEINMANAQMEVDVARQKLQNYLNKISRYPQKADPSQEQALRDDARAREEAQNQVIMSRNQEVKEAERALEDSRMETASDSTLEITKQQLEGKKKELNSLKKLKKKKGIFKAPSDGVVKSISVSTGSQTTQEAAVILYQTEGELKMTGTISREDLKYVEKGAKVQLEGSNGAKVSDASLLSVSQSEEGGETRQITVMVPEGKFSIGETVEFEIQKDAGPYKCCVPVSALYGAEGQEYVYVLDTEKTVLGEVQVARKVSVNIKERNETTAALQEGILSTSQKVIVESDRAIEEGSRVRLQES